MKIGCIGQGWVGRNIADNFERRNYSVVRYALEPEYIGNRELIHSCDVVFIAVPTPSTPTGFDFHIVDEALTLVGDGKVAVVKSTLLPGTTETLQARHPAVTVLFSPEFLCESTAAYDVANPIFNIVGLPAQTPAHEAGAKVVMEILPPSPRTFIVPVRVAELFKYAHNVQGFMRVILSNLFFDVADSLGVEWSQLEQIMNKDPMMSPYYNAPVHKSGRGAGGNCFIKDMAAFRELFSTLRPDDVNGIAVLDAQVAKNLELLAQTGKSQDLVRGVYGDRAKDVY